MKKLTILLALAGILTNSCIDQLNVNIDHEEFILVVEGFISTQPGPYTIKLSRSAKYGTVFEGIIRKVDNAQVFVRDQKGELTQLNNIGGGEYETPAGFRALVGSTYTLQVTENTGKTYYSIPETVLKAPEIDSLIIEYKKFPSTNPLKFVSGVEVYSQWQDPENEDNYYMWRNTGTYQIETHPEDRTIVGPTGQRIPAPLDCCAFCWIEEDNGDNSVRIMKDSNSNGNLVTNLAAFIEDDGRRYMDKYFITLEQHSISKEAFLFFKLLRNQLGVNGDIFDPPPATIRGNMISVDNPEEIVIGYFMASDVSVKSIFLPREFLGDNQRSVIINNDCQILQNATASRPSYWYD